MRKLKLTDRQKKVLNIVVTCVQIAVVLMAITVSIIVLVNPSLGTGEVAEGKTKLLPVLTDSMKGSNKNSFNAGDLVIAEQPKDPKNLKAGEADGDIVVFRIELAGTVQLNIHRIISRTEMINEETGEIVQVIYTTKGDNNALADGGVVSDSEVLAVYKYHLKGIGGAINWLQKPTNFLLVIILPLAVLFIYNVVLFVRILMQAKISQVEEENQALQIDEEEIKQKAIADYLAAQKELEKNQETGDQGDENSTTQGGDEN